MRKKMLNMILFVIVIAPLPGFGQSAVEVESETFREAKVILQNMSNFLSSADQFSFNANMTENRLYDKDYSIFSDVTSEVTIRRPDKVYADIKSDYNHKRYWYDGQKITLLTVSANMYATAEATGDIDKMADFVYDNYGVSIPLIALGSKNPYAFLMDSVVNGYNAGLHRVDGVLCHHLLFIEDNAEWEIWIEDGPAMIPRKFAVKYKFDDLNYVFVASINDWKFNEYAPDEMFHFIAPPAAGIIEFVK